VLPGTRLRIENSYGNGVLVTVRGRKLSDNELKALEAEMKRICALAAPFTCSVVPKQEAMEYFRGVGQEDKVQLLKWRAKETFRLYECCGMKDYFYGEMVYDTSYVSVFALSPTSQGFVLCAGSIIATGTPKGVLMGTEGAAFLQPGDEIVCAIEGIGELRNTVQ
ncbi:MAG: fumarylacetoacetate hydrolase family protein, partial [Clostridia bacterium]|nr:fumarylacetoacetate hydrolase family protein [Clostridia bacterium]